MLVNGLPFPATSTHYDDLRSLRASAGNGTLLPTFTPQDFPHSRYIWRLLYHCFFCHGVCSFLTGSFVLFMAGIFNVYTSASIFVAMSESSIVKHIFRKEAEPPSSFYIHGFHFQYLNDDEDADVVYYDISCDDFNVTFIFYGTDTTPNCDLSSNLDFVHFIWARYERFHFSKYCLAIVRRDYSALPELLCLKYYRAESCGWRDSTLCGEYSTDVKTRLRPMTGCVHPDPCTCSVCLHQPPSLLPLASNATFQSVLNIEQFTLTSETTYQQYVVAANPYRVPRHQLLPPDFPNILIRFRCDYFPRKLHLQCPGNGTWEAEMGRTFNSQTDAIESF